MQETKFYSVLFQKLSQGDKTNSTEAMNMTKRIACLTKDQLRTVRKSMKKHKDPEQVVGNIIDLFDDMQVLLSVSLMAEADYSSVYATANKTSQGIDAVINMLCQSHCLLAYSLGELDEVAPDQKECKPTKKQCRLGKKFSKMGKRQDNRIIRDQLLVKHFIDVISYASYKAVKQACEIRKTCNNYTDRHGLTSFICTSRDLRKLDRKFRKLDCKLRKLDRKIRKTC